MKGYKLMKNRFLVLISLVLSIFMLSGTIAFADYEITKCIVDETGCLTLEGKASRVDERVAIEIVKPSFSASDIENITSDGIMNIFGNILELTAGEDAVFKTTFKLGSTPGYYDIRLKGEHASEPVVYSDAFLYLSDEDRAALLSNLNTASDGAGVKLAIENACFYNYLDINYPAYNSYSSAQKDALALFVLNSRKGGFASAKEASLCISYGISSANLSTSSDADSENVFANDAGYIGFTQGDAAFEIYSEFLNDAAKKSVVSALKANSPYANIDSYIAVLYDNIILNAISGSDDPDKVEIILSGFEDYLGDKLGEYKACTVKTEVNTRIVGQSFDTVNILIEQIDAYITEFIANALADYAITKCSVDEKGYIAIEGKAAQNGERVTIEIVKPSLTTSDIENITSDGIMNIFGNILELTAGENSFFKTTFKLGGSSGYYDIRMKGEYAPQPAIYSDAFLYLSDEDRAALLNDLNTASDGAGVKLAIENACYYNYLDINYPAYNNFTATQKDTLALFVLNSRKGGFASAKEASLCVSYGISSANLSIASNADAEKVFTSDAKYIGFAEGDVAFGFYDEILDDDAKRKVVSVLKANSPYVNTDSYIAILYDNIIPGAISGSDNHSQVEKILLGFEPYLGDKISKYKNCTVKTDVNKKIVGQSFSSVNNLIERIDAYITEFTTQPEEKEDDVIISTDNKAPMPSGPKPSSPMGSGTSASPSTKPSPAVGFGDLSGFDWAKESINALYNNGIISGKANGIFAPADSVTRAEFVKMIVLALFETDSSASSDFADVDKNSWSYPYISTAFKMGLVQGSANFFGASDNITRQDMAVIISRCMEKKNLIPASKDAVAFDDNNLISDYAKSAVAFMKTEGITNGKGNNLFAPLDNLTRAEAAVIIMRVINLL